MAERTFKNDAERAAYFEAMYLGTQTELTEVILRLRHALNRDIKIDEIVGDHAASKLAADADNFIVMQREVINNYRRLLEKMQSTSFTLRILGINLNDEIERAVRGAPHPSQGDTDASVVRHHDEDQAER